MIFMTIWLPPERFQPDSTENFLLFPYYTISAIQTGYHRLKFFAELSFKKATVSPFLHSRTPHIL